MSRAITGGAAGIDDDGRLLVRTARVKRYGLDAGEVHPVAQNDP
jgi:hypothetical protein